MDTLIKTDYYTLVQDVLKEVEGPLSVQPLKNVIIAVPDKQRVSVLCVGEDDGEDVFEKPIVVSIVDGKIRIDRNSTDLNIRKKLIGLGVPDEDIIRK